MRVVADEANVKIAAFIVRLVCGVLGLIGLAALVKGFVLWCGDDSVSRTVWTAMMGDEPAYHVVWRQFRPGGGLLWELTPNGVLPALHSIGLSVCAVLAAVFNRLWIYVLVIILLLIPR